MNFPMRTEQTPPLMRMQPTNRLPRQLILRPRFSELLVCVDSPNCKNMLFSSKYELIKHVLSEHTLSVPYFVFESREEEEAFRQIEEDESLKDLDAKAKAYEAIRHELWKKKEIQKTKKISDTFNSSA